MALETPTRKQTTIVEWITAGPYAVAVEIEATMLADRPGEPFLTPQTVQFLEQIAKDARAGNIDALKQVGKVFIQLEAANGKPAG